MNYAESLAYIEEKNKLGSVPGLFNITELLRRLGNPEKSVPVIHIAGTNGKGSVMTYIESILIEAGYMVGRYISPTIFDYRERFQINRTYISEEACGKVITEASEAVASMVEDGMESPTSFEIETAAALLYFRNQKVDVMLVECGMGGRLDATNVFDRAMVNIIASVSRDHMAFLGNTVQEITKEKLGIVKHGAALATYPLCAEAEETVEAYCRKNKVKRYQVLEDALIVRKLELGSSEFVYKGRKYEISISGDYQIRNAVTALAAMEAFNDRAEEFGLHKVSDYAMEKGLRTAKWPGRFSVLGDHPFFIADGAHNADAWKLLTENLNKYFTKTNIVYIIGVLRDKEYDIMLDYLLPSMQCAFTVTPDSSRAFDGKKLAELIRKRGKKACYAECLKEAVRLAEHEAGEAGIVVACGSLTFIGDIMKLKQQRGF